MDLPDNEIHLYFSFSENISEPGLLRSYRSLLTEDELAQMSRLYFARHRHQYLLTRALIRTTLSNYFPVKPADWQFDKNGYGKPLVSYPENIGPVSFNLSHCEGLILCGIARDHDIGVDVEDTQRSTRAAFDSLSRYFSPSEVADLAGLSGDSKKKRFFDYWTLKESYIKARGMGLAIPLDKFSFQFTDDKLHGLDLHPDLNDTAGNWQFWRMPVMERYRASVALNAANTFRVTAYDSVPLQGNESLALSFL